jgi:hypothetical protein
MPYLTKKEILVAPDLQFVEVEVLEWGGTVRMRGLTGAERDRFEESVLRSRSARVSLSLTNVRARLVAMACVDEDGKRLFEDADVEALGEKSGKTLDRLFDVAARLSGLQPGDVEALAKNSPGARSGASGSG